MRSICLLLIASVLFVSCKKDETYPNEPIISFKALYTIKDDSGLDDYGVISLNFTDGDGNIGYKSEGQNEPIFDDPNSIYYRNFQVELYERKNGMWVLNSKSSDMGGRIPYLTPEGSNKALNGEIKMNIDLPLSVSNDTIFYKVFIYDRTPTKSNVVQTPEIIINT